MVAVTASVMVGVVAREQLNVWRRQELCGGKRQWKIHSNIDNNDRNCSRRVAARDSRGRDRDTNNSGICDSNGRKQW